MDSAPDGDAWLHEVKYDGYRIGCSITNGSVRLESRNGQDWTSAFAQVAAAATALKVESAMLDGEVAVLLPDGRTSFQALQNARSGTHGKGQLVYFVFDILELNGQNLTALALEHRKTQLEQLLAHVPAGGTLRYAQHLIGRGPEVLAQACKLGMEGIVSKRRDQPYRAGRGPTWVKSKCIARQEFVVGGYTEGEGARQGIGSLLIGYYDERGELKFGGKVGNGPGFTAEYTTRLQRDFEGIAQKECPFRPRPPGWLGRHARWVRPERVVEVSFTEWTEGGAVRHPLLQGFRSDKVAAEVRREGERATVTPALSAPASTARRKRMLKAEVGAATTVAGIAITTPERPVYPKLGLTKLDMARYYERVAPWMVPYVAGRPLTLVRCEHGVTRADALRSECKFLRHESGWHRWAGPALHRLQIAEQKKVGEYLVADSVEGLVSLVQGDITEVHCWNARSPYIEEPDQIVLDLDPGPKAAWPAVVRASGLVRTALEALGLMSWPKLTGGKGLHVVVPFEREHPWDAVFTFAHAFGAILAQRHPEVFTTDYAKGVRGGRILLDYKRNHRAAVAVAAYSARAHPGGTISLPLRWSEIKPAWPSDRFTVANVFRRLDKLREDPWLDFWSCRQRLVLQAP